MSLTKATFQAHPHDSPVRTLRATDQALDSIDLPRHGHRLKPLTMSSRGIRIRSLTFGLTGDLERAGQAFVANLTR